MGYDIFSEWDRFWDLSISISGKQCFWIWGCEPALNRALDAKYTGHLQRTWGHKWIIIVIHVSLKSYICFLPFKILLVSAQFWMFCCHSE
jgi:hypothetical protein